MHSSRARLPRLTSSMQSSRRWRTERGRMSTLPAPAAATQDGAGQASRTLSTGKCTGICGDGLLIGFPFPDTWQSQYAAARSSDMHRKVLSPDAPRSGPSWRTRLMMPARKPLGLRMRLQAGTSRAQAATGQCPCPGSPAQLHCRLPAAHASTPVGLVPLPSALLQLLQLALTPGWPQPGGQPRSWPPHRSALQARMWHTQETVSGQQDGAWKQTAAAFKAAAVAAAAANRTISAASWSGRDLECSKARWYPQPNPQECRLRLGQPLSLTLNVVQQDLVNLRLAQVAAVKQAVQLVLLRGGQTAGKSLPWSTAAAADEGGSQTAGVAGTARGSAGAAPASMAASAHCQAPTK